MAGLGKRRQTEGVASPEGDEKTGGGKDEKTTVLSPVEEKVIAVLGPTACEGIAGAVDSYAEQPSQRR